ncbi:MAG: glycosyltransferase family 2 protein [Actinomycetota bacterium]
MATGTVYLTWRLVFTGSGAHPVMFFLLLAAEAFGFLRLHMETSLLGDPRPPTRSPERTMAPDADVIVVVTDEPASEVRAAVLSARLIQGYTNLRIVDRDDRPDVAELANRLGLTRIVGGWEADLGDLIDRAIDECTSLFALLMPADLVVMPDILEVTAGAFDDPEVGVVVSRIENTNAAHAVDYGGYGEHRRRDELMVAKLDEAGSLPWWPGMAVVRRSAIREIGGMSSGHEGVTMATGVRLQAEGWRITDVPVLVGRRLAPWNDDRHLHRWARDLHERLAVLVDKDAPRRNEHSTRLGRRAYRAVDLHVGRSIQRLVLIGMLFAVLFTSSLPMTANPVALIVLWGAWQGSSIAYRRQAQAPIGFQTWMSNDLRLLMTDLSVARRALPGKPLGVELVDPAPGAVGRRIFLLTLQIALAGTLAVFGMGILRPSHGDFVTLSALGAGCWLWVMALQARSQLKLRQVRQNFRTFDELKVLASDGKMGVIGVSPFGLDVVSSKPLKVGDNVRIAFALPQVDGSTVRFDCPTAVRRSARDGNHHVAYLRFAQLSDAEVDQITEYCSVVAGHHELRDIDPAEDAPVAPLAEVLVQPRA